MNRYKFPDFEPFPYFAILAGSIILGVAAYAPPGKGQEAALTVGASLATGGLTAYGLHLKYQDKEE
jgi:hypothetical protein